MEALVPDQILCAHHSDDMGPISRKTTISNLKVLHFPCMYYKQIPVLGNKYTVLFHAILWSEKSVSEEI